MILLWNKINHRTVFLIIRNVILSVIKQLYHNVSLSEFTFWCDTNWCHYVRWLIPTQGFLWRRFRCFNWLYVSGLMSCISHLPPSVCHTFACIRLKNSLHQWWSVILSGWRTKWLLTRFRCLSWTKCQADAFSLSYSCCFLITCKHIPHTFLHKVSETVFSDTRMGSIMA